MSIKIRNVSPDHETIEKVIEIPLHQIEEKGIVIIHCCFEGEGAIRIWRSTFLIDRQSNHRSRLLHVENISMAPNWTVTQPGQRLKFTLYFEGLPGDCKSFDLREIIPQPGGFYIPGINRNQEDVYEIDIF